MNQNQQDGLKHLCDEIALEHNFNQDKADTLLSAVELAVETFLADNEA